MWHFRPWSMCIALLVVSDCLGQHSENSAAAKPKDSVRDAMGVYVDKFNAHDADGVAALWTEKALHVDTATGRRSEGRQAIHDDLVTVFRDRPSIRLGIEVDHVRLVRPDLAQVEARVIVSEADSEPVVSSLCAILAKSEDCWRIDAAHESELPMPPSASDALSDLDWLLGAWEDESEDVRVLTNVRWSANKAFLVRSYTIASEEGMERQGSQVIGWDPRQRQIRSWNFDSDGSFGEGAWTRSGADWVVRITVTRADGAIASGTQILRPLDNDSFTVQTVGLEVDGELRPSVEPVKVIRVEPLALTIEPSEETAAPAETERNQ